MDSVLVMGSDSAIGSHIVEELKGKFKVIGLAKKPRPDDTIPTYRYDLTSIDADSFPDLTADVCIMLSSITDIDKCEKEPLEAFQTNVVGLVRTIRFLRARDIRRLVFFSTGTVCSGSDLPMREDCTPAPPNIYSLTKYLAELVAKYHSTALEILVIRPFFVYGPRTRKNRLIFNLINDIASGKSVKIHKDSKPLVNPIFIGDAVRAISLILEKGLPDRFECLNLAGKDIVSIRELALLIGDILGKKVDFIQMGSEQTNRIADITKLQSLYNYQHKYTIRDGLYETVQWMLAESIIK